MICKKKRGSIMKKAKLGRTGILVSRLSYGTAALSEMDAAEGGRLLLQARSQGIDLWDGSHDYNTYDHMHHALQEIERDQVVIITKTYAEDEEKTERDVSQALEEIGTEYIDILLLHYTRPEWLGKPPRLPEPMLSQKDAGRVRHIGFAAHSVETVRLAKDMPEVDVIEAIISRTGEYKGHGEGGTSKIEDGGIEDMLDALKSVHKAGIGVIGMKVIGNGLLLNTAHEEIQNAVAYNQVDTLCIGMVSEDEISANARAVEQVD
jgi:aryl-alcohol dehydrogenase-like predicted oxidoreductase